MLDCQRWFVRWAAHTPRAHTAGGEGRVVAGSWSLGRTAVYRSKVWRGLLFVVAVSWVGDQNRRERL